MARRFPGLTLAYILTKCVGVIAPNTQSEISGPLFSLYAGELQVLTQTAADLDQKENLNQALDEVEKLRSYSAGVTKEVSLLETNAAMLLQNIEAQDKKRRSDWEIEKAEFLSNLRKEAEEAARIDASIDLWNIKARSHDIAFRIGAGTSALLLISAIGVTIFLGKDFVQSIADQFSDKEQYFGIGLLLLPTLALAWIVRIIIKITLQSLSLAQDARQRHTQILTYLRLLGDSSNPISPKERVLALSAIFRPLPGQGSDDVNPPTVAELLRDAVNEVTKTK